MTRAKRFCIIGIIVSIQLTAAGCTPREAPPRRWRVTVEVETPAGLATGSGVVETHFRPRNEIIYTMDSDQRWVLGEAIAVDVPGGMVFALLSRGGDYGFYRPQMSFGWVPGPDGRLHRVQFSKSEEWLPGTDGQLRPVRLSPLKEKTPERGAAWRSISERRDRSHAEIDQALAEGRSFTLLEEGWPRFVLLRDPTDPKSAILLAPSEIAEASIDDIKVRRIIVQETDEPVTRTLAARLPWLNPDGGSLSGRVVYPPQISADLISNDDFRMTK